MKFSLAKSENYSGDGRNWYDTKEGVINSLKDLRSFNYLLQQRQVAGYQNGEKLNEFYLYGVYWLDNCGNCAKARENLKIKFPEIPNVMTREEFWVFVESKLDKEYFMSFEYNGGNIPTEGLKCAHCGKTWTMENCFDTVVRHETQVIFLTEFVGKTLAEVENEYNKKNDAIYRFHPSFLVRNDDFIDLSLKYPNPENDWQKDIVVNEKGWLGEEKIDYSSYVICQGDETPFDVWKFYHQECNRIDLALEKKNKFQEVFKKAGFEVKLMTPVKNEYCQCEICAPWFLVDTQYGQFKIGWRKWVINIEWVNVKQMKNFWKLFTREDVTKWNKGIHAWGYEKSEEYLKRIFKYLKWFKAN